MENIEQNGQNAGIEAQEVTPTEVPAENISQTTVEQGSEAAQTTETVSVAETITDEGPADAAAELQQTEGQIQTDAVSESAAVSEVAETPVDEMPVIKEQIEPKWYIVQALTGQEDSVRDRIENTLDELNLRDRVLRVLVPEEETVEIKGTKRIERKRKMYPGYVFIEMMLDEDTWYKIRSTAGVARFIGGKTSPQPVSDREMQRVLKQLGIKEKEITVEFEVGEPIRIISGSFRGYTGSVSEINAPKSKLKAMINIFGRDTSVEVDFDRVEKVI